MNSSYNFEETIEKIDYVDSFKEVVERLMKQKPNLEDQQGTINSKVDLILYQTEYSYLLNELIFETKFIIKHFEDVPQRIKDFFETLKTSMYTRKFIIVDNEIKETEDGYLETKREEYLNSPQFKQLQQMLEDSSQK